MAPPFIDRQVFEQLMSEIETLTGGKYQDTSTPYTDLSNLVVAWLASSSTTELRTKYAALGLAGSPNVRSIREAARRWMNEHRPELLSRLDQGG